jgi:hypothetical protein
MSFVIPREQFSKKTSLNILYQSNKIFFLVFLKKIEDLKENLINKKAFFDEIFDLVFCDEKSLHLNFGSAAES